MVEEEKREEPTPDISEETQRQLMEQSRRKDRTLAEIISDIIKSSKNKKKSVLYDEFLEG